MARQHRELRRRGKHGCHAHEVPAPEAELRFRADEEEAAVVVEGPLFPQVPDDHVCGAVERWEVVPPLWPEPVADAMLLQAQREDLLRDDVARLGGWRDRFDPPASP